MLAEMHRIMLVIHDYLQEASLFHCKLIVVDKSTTICARSLTTEHCHCDHLVTEDS